MTQTVSFSTSCGDSATGKIQCARPRRTDFWQALSGVLLIIFILMHALFVSSVLISPKLENAIAWLLETIGIAYIAGPAVLALMVWHFWLVARKMPFRQGELCVFWQHARAMRHQDTWLWLVQVITGVIVIVMVSIHLYAMMTAWPHTAEHSAQRVQSGWLTFYLVLLPAVQLHMGIGFYRLGVKYGYITSAKRKRGWQYACILMGTLIVLGVLTLLRHSYLTV